MDEKVKKLLTYIGYFFALIIFLIGIAYGINSSDFSKIKKYDEPDSNTPKSSAPISKEKQRYAAARYYTTSVTVQDNGMISLGDFTMNLADGKVLTANISIKYADNSDSWFSSEESKIVSKSSVLRSSVINAMHGSTARTNSSDVKDRIKDNLNSHLREGEVEAVYFNKFIVQ